MPFIFDDTARCCYARLLLMFAAVITLLIRRYVTLQLCHDILRRLRCLIFLLCY